MTYAEMALQNPRILLIDSYDSFTHNLASLFREAIPGCNIHVVKNDALSPEELVQALPHFTAVVVGPGPGSPENPHDIGVVRHLWKVADDDVLPVFGVCLGLQSMAIEYGAKLKRLNVVKHGQISRIIHDGSGLFKGVGEANAVRYHSLHVDLQAGGEVEELAWADDGAENGRVVMAARHKTRPFWAVQYHPESVCTAGGGVDVLRNFWRLAQSWTLTHDRQQTAWTADMECLVGSPWPHVWSHTPPSSPGIGLSSNVATSILHLPDASVAFISELLGACEECQPFVMLESAAQPGRFSIIGSLTPDSPQITYTVGDPHVSIARGHEVCSETLGSHDIWSWLASFMHPYKGKTGAAEIPFWGGLVGYLGYEIGVDSLSIPLPRHSNVQSAARHPDVNLVFVERSVVLDHNTGKVYVQSIRSGDEAWLEDTARRLRDTHSEHAKTPSGPLFSEPPVMKLPDDKVYKTRIQLAKEHLFAGDSYELCLTAQTHITTRPRLADTKTSNSWDLYKILRQRNPAPHSGYLRLHPTTFLSSSPERFLSFSRAPNSKCQLRPIKGTVRKAPGITRAVAEEALVGSPKEVAENLMIVDLIRHDLHGVLGEDVAVKQFCQVEEYETVWQLVSVIEGKPPQHSVDGHEGELGWEVLRRSLPPGSMTGAPKKRSVEILQTLEDGERGIYSGVFGYWCVGGGGDWSVVIRSCFRYDDRFGPHGHRSDEKSPDLNGTAPGTEEWVIGAGGAITALSDADDEWDEMVVKLESVLRTFEAAAQ
ncbi:para-aminobenzoate synthase [Dentipellis sp. KUC8613]|nr:para-aminobenzoate synthase [Dentipellis sp. KUC8613]